MTDNEKQLMLELKKQGKGYKAISKELGISVGTVASYFKRKSEKEAAGIRNCKCCGRKFSQTKGHRQRIFCSDDCRRSWWRKNQDKRNLKAYYECTCKKFDKKHPKCQTPVITEDKIKSMFIKAYNQAMVDKEHLVNDTNDLIGLLTDTTELDGKIAKLQAELDVISELVSKIVRENSIKAQSQAEYEAKYNELAQRYEKTNVELNGYKEERNYRKGQVLKLQTFMDNILKSKESLTEWDSTVWNILVSSGIVHRDGSITFKFNNGTEITMNK